VPAGTPVRIVLELRGPPGGVGLRLRARGDGSAAWLGLRLAAEERPAIVLQARAGADGVAIDLDSGEGVMFGDRAKRRVGVGVIGLMACREDDLPARLSALERATG
jgi:hypothetical protein